MDIFYTSFKSKYVAHFIVTFEDFPEGSFSYYQSKKLMSLRYIFKNLKTLYFDTSRFSFLLLCRLSTRSTHLRYYLNRIAIINNRYSLDTIYTNESISTSSISILVCKYAFLMEITQIYQT